MLEAAAQIGAEHRAALVKAMVVGANTTTPRASQSGGEVESVFASAGAIEPPYDPLALCLLFEHSNSLRQNVDAFATNIDGFGYRLEPAIDLEADDADRRVGECMFLERLHARERGALPIGTSLEPSSDEISTKRRELVQLARIERARLSGFFEFCSFDQSFVALRRRTRQDLEVTGNAYWEILRNGKGEVAKLVYVPAYTMRLLPLDSSPVMCEELVRVSPVQVERVSIPQRLRRLVQVFHNQRTFFKTFGDPRIVSRKTGEVYPSAAELWRADPTDRPATEVLHFAIPSPRSPYGVPRWIGTLLAVLGSRTMEEVNYQYFGNKSVPPLALLVSGGHLAEDAVTRIERFIEENIKGKANFHKILILEAEGSGGADSARPQIEIHPLTQAQQADALFQQYDARNVEKVGSSFRIPRLLRGDTQDINRSTSESSMRFAEDQVFAPEREEFDYTINRKLLADMGIRFWRFRSQTPMTRDPERLTNMVEKLVRVGVLTPEEGRTIAGDVFNCEFRKLDAPWVKLPITLTLAGIQTGQTSPQSKPTEGTIVAQNEGEFQ